MAHFPGVSQRIVYQHIDAVFLQFADHVDNPGVPQVRHVFLERKAKDAHTGRIDQPPLPDQQFDAGFRHMLAHAVVDAPPGQNDLRMAAEFLGLEGQVVRIDADAVPAHQARSEAQGVPLGVHALDDLGGVDAHAVEHHRELVHEGNVYVALRVLDDLHGLGGLDGRDREGPSGDHDVVDPADELGGLVVHARDHLADGRKGMHAVAGVDAFGAVAHLEVLSAPEAGFTLENRHADVLGDARVDGGLVDHDAAGLQVLAQRLRRADDGR